MCLLAINLKVAGNHVITKSGNALLPLIGIALMLVYEYCNTSCSYLKGSFLGIDLKWVGIIYMVVLFFSAFAAASSFAAPVQHLRTILISAGVGVEFFLIGFQVLNHPALKCRGWISTESRSPGSSQLQGGTPSTA